MLSKAKDRPSDAADLVVSVEKELAKLIETLKTCRKAGNPERSD